ncbi:MAG: DUF1284 domain-containing protein [Planctomycetes bacterium]|nr:DUF1284 domain-containing protein [Planctomycetota bacterium]
MQATISIKPHHFVDIITSFGTGYRVFQPHPYGHAVHTVSEKIYHNREVYLKIELGIDDICRPCAHNVAGSCDDTIDTSYRPSAPSSKNEWNLLVDKRWCKRLGIKQGDQLTARELCERIRDKISDITDIYREVPAGKTIERSAKLVRGLEYYLEHLTK